MTKYWQQHNLTNTKVFTVICCWRFCLNDNSFDNLIAMCYLAYVSMNFHASQIKWSEAHCCRCVSLSASQSVFLRLLADSSLACPFSSRQGEELTFGRHILWIKLIMMTSKLTTFWPWPSDPARGIMYHKEVLFLKLLVPILNVIWFFIGSH